MDVLQAAAGTVVLAGANNIVHIQRLTLTTPVHTSKRVPV